MIEIREEISGKLSTAIHIVANESNTYRTPLIGMHGFGENSDIQMERLISLNLLETHLYCCLGAPYDVSTSMNGREFGWNSRGKLEEAYSEIIELIDLTIDAVHRYVPNLAAPQFYGFSQGVAPLCAYLKDGKYAGQASVLMSYPIVPWMLSGIRMSPRTLFITGNEDTWVSAQSYKNSLLLFEQEQIRVTHREYQGSHFPNEEALKHVRDFLLD